MFFPNRLVDHVPLAPLTSLTLLVYSPTALRTTPVRRALGVPAPPPVQPIYIRCLPSSPSVSPPTHRFVVSSGPLNSTSSKCKKAFPLRVTQVSSGSPVARAQAPQNPAGHLPLASSGAPAAPDRERLDGGGGGATLEQHVFRRVTRRLAPAPSRDAAAWIGPKPSSGILCGPGPRTRHPSTL
ncbi:PREDICTED: rho GTPase-activating protein 44 isoform X3 [Capra hircus]|uniref:rho GTPase-activating protein 44 isoform X3 n=1 Tax=Capra hircus TaxID=9925 RepID=UPI0008477451|nr:PREDICTED: rho GTPase-activating protein 44 isoform X3 [Capra hircus]